MRQRLRSPKRVTVSGRRTTKPRQNALGHRGHNYRPLGFETLEVRTLLSVAPLSVAVISDGVAQAQEVCAAAATGTIAIVYHANTMTTTGLVDLVASVSAAHGGDPIAHLAIVTHGGPGEVDLGKGDDLSLATMPSQAAALGRLRSVLTSDARLDLYACSVAAGGSGKTFVDELAAVTGATVYASDNPVGTVPGADFVWEYHTGQPAPTNELFSIQELETVSRLCLSDGAQFVSESPASGTSVATSTAFTETVTMKNTGTTTWSSGVNGYTLNRNPQGTDPFQQGSVYYATLSSSVSPGNSGVFTMYLTSPSAPGTYTETWQMSNVSSVFFGGTATLTRTVVDMTPPAVSISSPYSGQVFTTSSITVSGSATDSGGSGLHYVLVDNGANGSNGVQYVSGNSASYSVSGITLVQGSNLIGVEAYDNAGNVSTLATVTVTYNPVDTTPPTVSISSPYSGQVFNTSPITVSGTASDSGGAGLSDVIVDNGANNSNGYQFLSGNSASFSVSGITLVQGSNLIGVKTYDNAGNPSTLATVTVTYNPSTTSPTAPVLSNYAPVWDTTAPAGPAVTLYWTASSGTPTPLYDLYRNGSLYAANLNQTSFYNELGLCLGQTYTYYVSAHNSLGTAQSNTLSVTIPTSLGSTVPGVPTGLSASATTATSIHLTWTPVSAPGVSYLVYRSASSSGPWNLLQSNVPQASFDDVYSVQPNSTYYYAVESTNAGGTSALSLPAFATTPILTKPTAPTIVSAVVHGASQIIVTWTDVLSTGEYILQRATLPTGNYATVQVLNAGTASYADTVSTPSTVSTTYEYRIYSQVSDTSSDPSNVVQATLSVPVTIKPVQSAPLPPLAATLYSNVAQVYKFNGSTWTPEDTPALLQHDIQWTLPTIILTHGWMDSLAGCTYITQFASQFWSAHSSGYNVLAVDWSSAGNISLGSNPDGATGWLANLTQNHLNLDAVKADAQNSAYNGIVAAMPLADKLFAAGIEPNNVMLIGHSNGAGFMASLAERLYADEKAAYGNAAPEIQELAALDAPVATDSYWQVLAAASSVSRIDNYFASVTPETPLQANSAPLGFGAPMFSTVGQITNFALNYADGVSVSGVAHFEVPLRYALTASATAWGFAASDFMTGGNGNSGTFDGYRLWGETGIEGLLQPLKNVTSAQIAAFQAGLSESVNVGTVESQYTKEGLILLGNGNWGIGTEVLVGTFLADSAITVSSAVVNTLDIVEQRVSSAVNTLTNIAESGANYVVSGVESSVQQSVDTFENWLGFTAASPTFTSLAISVPQNAAFLSFDLTVTNPGNDDQLLVGIGNNVIGQVDLASVEQSGTQTIQLAIAQFAGQTDETLAFYMPSSVSSTAAFVVGNISVETLAVDTAPSVSSITKNVNVGGALAFAAADFTGAFTDPDNNGLQMVMITALPQDGTLTVGGTAVVLDQEIPVASLSTLSYTPTGNYIGSDVLSWNGSDGSLYAVAGANVNLTVNSVWTATGGGTFSWGSGGDWQGGVVPGAMGDAALLGTAVGSGTATITLDVARTLSKLTFSPSTGGSYVLSGSGGNSLQLANSGSPASIAVTSGTSSIKAPVVLGDNVDVTAGSGTSLTISGPVSENGGSHALTLSGAGSLVLSGTNNYTGGTFVTGGTLVVTASSALPNGGALTIGAGGTLIFDPSVQASPSASVAVTSVPIASSADTTAAPVTASAATSNATSAATCSDTNVASAVPSSTSPASSSRILVPTVVDVSASVSVTMPGSLSVSDSATGSPVPSSASAATLPVALPLPASASLPKTKDLGKSSLAGTLGTPAADRVVWSSIAKRRLQDLLPSPPAPLPMGAGKYLGDLAWLGQSANSSDNSDQHRKKDVAILALDAVFARYGQ